MSARVRVGDVLALQRRLITPSPDERYRLIGVYSFGKGIFHREPQLGLDLGDYRFFRVVPGDLVLSNIQAWEGAIAHASHLDEGTIGTHRFLTYTPIDDRIDTDWARWFFLSEPGMELIRRAAPGTTVRNRTLAIERFENLEIPLPPIDEQRRIAVRLDRIADSVTAVDSLMSLSTQLAVAARAALTRSVRHGCEWREVRLEALLHLRSNSVAVDPEATYPMAGVYSFGRGLFARAEMDGAKTRYRSLHRLEAGQLVLSRLKAWEGALALVPTEFDGFYLSPEFPAFGINADLAEPKFLEALLTSESFWGRLRRSSKGIGARKQRVHAESLLEQVVELPPIEVQRAVLKAIELVDDARRRRESMKDHARALLPAALNEAFAGLS